MLDNSWPQQNQEKCPVQHYFYFWRTLRKKCSYSELFWSVFFQIQTEYGQIRSISPYLAQIRENTDQNNSEYGHFLRKGTFRKRDYFCQNVCYFFKMKSIVK